MMFTPAMMMVAFCALYTYRERDRLDMGQDGISKPEYQGKLIWTNGFSFGLSTVRKENLRRCLKQEMKRIQKKERVIKKMVMMDVIEKRQPSLYRIM